MELLGLLGWSGWVRAELLLQLDSRDCHIRLTRGGWDHPLRRQSVPELSLDHCMAPDGCLHPLWTGLAVGYPGVRPHMGARLAVQLVRHQPEHAGRPRPRRTGWLARLHADGRLL